VSALKIGEVARQAQVGVETIRYYERQGLLDPPQRRASGYRQYDESVVSRLQFIRRAKTLGFTLVEIRELLGLWFGGDTRCEQIRARAAQKIADIEEKIRSLQKMKKSLKEVVRRCEHRDTAAECPLWEGLSSPPEPPPSLAAGQTGRASSVRKTRRNR
jgi:Hg(II)-responsive transcriptional regulator